MRIKSEEEEITDLHDLRSDLERFQQVYGVILAHDKQEEIVREALQNNVDLSVYGDHIDKELHIYSNISIRDYIRESVNIAQLHLYENE